MTAIPSGVAAGDEGPKIVSCVGHLAEEGVEDSVELAMPRPLQCQAPGDLYMDRSMASALPTSKRFHRRPT